MKNILILLGAGSLLATPAAAQDMSDVRCLMVSNVFSQNAKDPKARQIASSAMLFYGGRVTKLPPAQIQAALSSQQKLITGANAGSTMSGCVSSMERSLQAFQGTAAKVRAAAKPVRPKS